MKYNHNQRKYGYVAAVAAMLLLTSPVCAQDKEGAASRGASQSAPRLEFEAAKVVGGVSHESEARLMDPVSLDFNGDGIDDLVFGAPGMSIMGMSNAGAVFVLLGQKDDELTGRRDMTLWRSFDYRFDGIVQNGQLGFNIETGDFNGDGIKDLAIAEPGRNGRIYIVYGGKKLKRGHYEINDERISDVYFGSGENDSNFGMQMCVGDFNQDDIDDLAASYITSTSASNSTATTTNVSLLVMRRTWDNRYYSMNSRLYGKTTFSRAVAKGVKALYTCAAGDFNDDGLTDIALGMPLDSSPTMKAAGSVSVVYYPFKYSGTTIDLAEADPKWGIKIKGSQTGAMFGYSLAAGDFTSDGRTDLAVSSPNRLVNGPDREGSVFIIDGSHWPEASSEQPEDLRINGEGGQFGFRLQTLDVNRDNRPDLVVSAPYASVGGATGAGSLSAYLGGPHFVESLQNNMRPDFKVGGDQNMYLGFGAAFGDFNGDTKNDVIVRTAQDPDGRPNTGAYVVISDAQRMTPDMQLDKVDFRTIAAPAKGGTLETDVKQVNYGGKLYNVWFSKGGIGDRSVICLNEAANHDKDGLLYLPDSCDINIMGPQNTPISDVVVATNSDGSKAWLTIALPTFEMKNAQGIVAVIALPESIDKPLTLNLTESTLASEAITFYTDGERGSELGSKISWEDLDNNGEPDLIIGAPMRFIDQTNAGSVFIVKDVTKRKNGKYNLVSDAEVLTLEGFDDEHLGKDWQIIDFNLDGKKDLAVLAENTKNTLLEVFSTIYVIYDIGGAEVKNYNITSPEIAPLKVVAPMHKAGLKFVQQQVDINDDGHNDLVMLSPDYRAGLQRQGAVMALFASKERKSGTHSLANEALLDFSFVSTRNEKLADALFVRHNGTLELFMISDSMLARQSTLKRFVTGNPNVFSGNLTTSSFKRVASDVLVREPFRISIISDPALQNDEVWVHFPSAGESQSDQGIAHRLKL